MVTEMQMTVGLQNRCAAALKMELLYSQTHEAILHESVFTDYVLTAIDLESSCVQPSSSNRGLFHCAQRGWAENKS